MATNTEVKEREIVKRKNQTVIEPIEPGKYKVIVLNDDFTPIEFVIVMFMKVFKFTEKLSIELTKKVHNEGSAIAGIYTYEIAEQRGLDATTLARENGHPLVIKIEAE
jgi:ATP-dependent Clp protease adaptor protein ClpS